VQQFPGAGLRAAGETGELLHCDLCGCDLDYTRKDTVADHVRSNGHRRAAQERAGKGKISEFLCSQPDVQDQEKRWHIEVLSTVLAAGLPISCIPQLQPLF
jgi:hypothetical protein